MSKVIKAHTAVFGLALMVVSITAVPFSISTIGSHPAVTGTLDAWFQVASVFVTDFPSIGDGEVERLTPVEDSGETTLFASKVEAVEQAAARSLYSSCEERPRTRVNPVARVGAVRSPATRLSVRSPGKNEIRTEVAVEVVDSTRVLREEVARWLPARQAEVLAKIQSELIRTGFAFGQASLDRHRRLNLKIDIGPTGISECDIRPFAPVRARGIRSVELHELDVPAPVEGPQC